MSYIPRLRDKYTAEVVPAMMEKFNYKNVMQIPCITKVVLNQGVGAAVNDQKLLVKKHKLLILRKQFLTLN